MHASGSDWQPSITVDPGPYEAAIVGWQGFWITVLAGPRRPEEKRGGEQRPIRIPRPTKPPVTARFERSVADALAQEPPELEDFADIPPEHLPYWYEEGIREEEEAVPSRNERTIVRVFEGTNVIDLDKHADLIEQARAARAEILIRFK
ncbi:MAG: hypothetical protein WKF65_09775 [Gaiellaceae bacterium]